MHTLTFFQSVTAVYVYNKLDAIVQITVIIIQSATVTKLKNISGVKFHKSTCCTSKALVSPELLAASLHSVDSGCSHRARTPAYLPCWSL